MDQGILFIGLDDFLVVADVLQIQTGSNGKLGQDAGDNGSSCLLDRLDGIHDHFQGWRTDDQAGDVFLNRSEDRAIKGNQAAHAVAKEKMTGSGLFFAGQFSQLLQIEGKVVEVCTVAARTGRTTVSPGIQGIEGRTAVVQGCDQVAIAAGVFPVTMLDGEAAFHLALGQPFLEEDMGIICRRFQVSDLVGQTHSSRVGLLKFRSNHFPGRGKRLEREIFLMLRSFVDDIHMSFLQKMLSLPVVRYSHRFKPAASLHSSKPAASCRLSSRAAAHTPGLAALVLLLSMVLSAANCTPQYVLEDASDWIAPDSGSYYLDFQKIVSSEKLTWLQAAEWQNGMRDCLFGKTRNHRQHFAWLDECYQKGRDYTQKPESGYQQPSFAPHEFVVAFDLDETLLSQWYESGKEGKHSFQTGVADYFVKDNNHIIGPKYVSLIPGWQQAMERLVAIPGCKGIVLFTAKEDAAAQDLVDRWFLEKDGKKVPIREYVLGVFTRNYLTRNSKAAKPSKDLRLLDPSLEHVLIVDDNPTRLFQTSNVRVFPIYAADFYLEDKDSGQKKFYEGLLGQIVDEIAEAAAWAAQNKMIFSRAWFPYSDRGRPYLDALTSAFGRPQALQRIRTNKSWTRPHYYSIAKEPVEGK
jgi:hypothetical protein